MAEAHLSCTERCIRAGFKFGNTGPHNSRTMMLGEMARCLDVLPPDARRADYRTAIVDRNILGKGTESTRKECFRRLRELYALEPAVPLFGIYRQLDATDAAARPILSLLVACARDPLLRSTMPVILGAGEGSVLGASHFDDALERAFPGCMKPKIRAATARHISSTWTQSGHLLGRMEKTRARVSARPAALVMAMILGTLQDAHGVSLFGRTWCQILDLNAAQAQALAAQAHREGLLNLRAVGAVVEVTFPRFAEAMNAGETS
jgi:hypothetical protein